MFIAAAINISKHTESKPRKYFGNSYRHANPLLSHTPSSRFYVSNIVVIVASLNVTLVIPMSFVLTDDRPLATELLRGWGGWEWGGLLIFEDGSTARGLKF